MKRLFGLALVLLFVTLGSGPVFSQVGFIPGRNIIEGFDNFIYGNAIDNSFSNLGGGARPAGMGNAYIGLGEDELSFLWNPASMIYLEKPKMGVQFVNYNDTHNNWYTMRDDSLGQFNSYELKAESKFSKLNSGGAVVPFALWNRQWAVGVGYRNIQSFAFSGDGGGFYGSKSSFDQSGELDALCMAASTLITEGIGFGINSNLYIRNSTTDQTLGRLTLFQIVGQTRIDTVDIRLINSSKYWGFNLDMGLSAKFDMFSGGLVIHLPYKLRQNDLMTQYVMAPPPGPYGVIFRRTFKTEVPFSLSMGAAIKPIEKLTIAFDLDAKHMSKTRVSYDWESAEIDDGEYDPDWEDLNQYRIGLEYMMDAGFAEIPLRFGLYNMPSIYRELTSAVYDTIAEDYDLVYGDQINPTILTFGSGLKFEKAWVDFAYQFGKHTYKSLVDTGTEDPPPTYDIKDEYSRLFISAGMFF